MSLIKINQKAYENNLKKIITRIGNPSKLICVFKDNAYGHGAKILAPIARLLGIDFIAVKNEKEAYELENFFKNILILSHRPHGNENPKFIYALNEISKIQEYKSGTQIHLKIDTGMHRNGICIEEIENAFLKIDKLKLNLKGVFTHFSSADELDASFFIQKEKFFQVKTLARKNYDGLACHSYNSAALFRAQEMPQDELFRIGIAQFGYGDKNLEKVLSLYAHKLSERVLKSGQSVGYGRSFSAEKNLKIATYDLGYADGLFRYNGKGDLFLTNNKKILGKISMDSFSCEECGDEVCVFNDAEIWANFFNTISYEILVKLHPDIPRILV
ncbi:alanine racemase [Campylobacter aviculae]|uniref:Alanine racemase n=1 Tax=Campylobacter aviculae TaxID=2510190 RepID=A0A4V6DWJ4_9BACT|nr:alanine racemase [Campylobacter aviculae]TKX32352.1 alanine racemase [Campylobacter aviculae]